MYLEIILISMAVIFLNIMDSATTSLCFRQYPDKELKGESNPFMRRLMLKNKLWAEIAKHGGVLIIIAVCVIFRDIVTLKYCTIILGLVVINNSYVLTSRHITKRKVKSPLFKLVRLIHCPEKAVFPIFIIISIGIAHLITRFLWV